YSGSAYLAMIFLLADEYKKHGEGIVGKRMLIGSYGSGNTMSVVSARVAGNAPKVISQWDLESVFAMARESSFDEYDRWVEQDGYALEEVEIDHAAAPAGTFRLTGVREDGYRLYQYQ
ncbi:MAG: hydroxymethylglutaryl-CoA synthase, partial [Spirochaetaceae bacterium]